MSGLKGKFAGLGAAIFAMLLLLSGNAGATAAPKLSGKYIVSIHKTCQAYFSANTSNPSKVIEWAFDDAGHVDDSIGVLNFNSASLTFTGSLAVVTGALIFQDLMAVGLPFTKDPLVASSSAVSGTYSTGPSSFTFTPAGQGPQPYTVVYADIVLGVAHQAFILANTVDNNGNSCTAIGSAIHQ